jgi:adenosylhomocysteine nucleosidase
VGHEAAHPVAPRRVAILAPMPSELRPLLGPLGLVRDPGGDLFRGRAGPVEVVAALTGIGMAAGARCAEEVLEAGSPDHLIVVGIAGAISPAVAVGDLVVPERVSNLDTGESLYPAALGAHVPRGTLVSSDAFLRSPAQAAHLAERGVVAIDMETAAIGTVCERRGFPWSVFRAISDRADDGSADAAVLDLVDAEGNPKLAVAARFVLTHPGRIPHLVRLARGARLATRAAAGAARAALAQPGG